MIVLLKKNNRSGRFIRLERLFYYLITYYIIPSRENIQNSA